MSEQSGSRRTKASRIVPGRSDQGPEILSELYLCDAWVMRTENSYRYVDEWSSWYEWRTDERGRGIGWYRDTTGSARSSIMDMMRDSGSWPDAQALRSSERRKLCSAGTVGSVLALGKAHRACATNATDWDADTMRLGIPGGVVDLRTGKVEDADQDELISRRCAVAPSPGNPKLWLGHLNKVLGGDADLIGYVQRYLGYMLTGEVGEHALLYLYGTGRNGKGTIVETVVRILGDYGYAAPVNLLMETKTERHPVELAMLRGARAVSCSEPPQGSRWDDGRIRSLTGGDTVTARRMGENLSSFLPTHKLILMGNHKPTMRSVDEAIKARFNLIDFTYTIPPEDRDPNFLEKLRDEWPQILNWMITGCLHWQESGLGRPASIVEATEEYLQDEDTFAQFMGECCDRGQDKWDSVALIYKVYGNWCERVGERVIGRKAFQSVLYETQGIERKKGSAPKAVAGLAVRQQFRDAGQSPSAAPSWMQD